MNRKYSVFIFNVGSCFDRYCSAYGKPYNLDELFDRIASIPLLNGVDLIATDEVLNNLDVVKRNVNDKDLHVASIAVDIFSQARWRQGSFSSTDASIRQQAIDDTKKVIDIAADIKCDTITLWPGQDGYDYLFQADYMQERIWFTECIKEICQYNKDTKITIEYKMKEPRTHSYLNTVGTTLLMVNDVNEANCGVALDFGHALLGYENPAESVAILKMYGDKLMHVHINDNYRYWDDDMIVGSVHTLEYFEFIYWLKKTGYNGWITFDQYPFRDDGRDAVAESAAWLDKLETIMENADMDEITEVIKGKNAIKSNQLMRKLLFQ
jgi:xylose isomerase